MSSKGECNLCIAHMRLAHVLSPVSRRGLVVDRVATLPELRVAGVAVRVALGQPLRALPRLKTGLAVHDIDLLESKRLGLVQEEVDHEAGGQVGAAEYEAEAVADAVGGVWGEETDHEVAEPVSCRCERRLLCSGAEREDLADDYPGERTPGHGE